MRHRIGPPLVYHAFRLLGWVSRHLPFAVAGRIARVVGLAVWATAARKRSLVQRNMRRALGPHATEAEVRRCARRAFGNYALYWVDSFRLPAVAPSEVDAQMSAEGVEFIRAGLDAGAGVILVLAHLGGWEYGGLWLALHDMPLTVVAERLEPPELFDWFCELRSALGLTVVALGPEAGGTLMRALRDGKAVALLADRDLTGTGVEVEFFGEATTLPAGPATLALRTGAVILPTAVYSYPDGRHHGVVRPPIPCERQGTLRSDVARVTALWAAELEELIRREPAQWHLFQPAWPSDRAGPQPAGRPSGE